MRIAIVSDIHGNLPALEAVVRDIRDRGVDAVLNLGDSLSGPLMPLETAHLLMDQGWLHLAGNHERQLLTLESGQRGASDEFAYSKLTATELAWIASLKPCSDIHGIFLCHGTPVSDGDYFLETVEPSIVRAATPAEIDSRIGGVGATLIACGHTHVPRCVRSSSGQWLVNPGSVGLPAYEGDAPYAHVMEAGSPDARYAMVEQQAGRWRCALISVPYDYQSMVTLAQARNRPDWAFALATGRMS